MKPWDKSTKAEKPGKLSGLKLYIAGPISGVSDYQERFTAMAKKCEAAGAIVLNPATLPSGMTQRDYMRICIAMLECADCAVFLRGWEQSAGARVEMAWCEKMGLPVYEEV